MIAEITTRTQYGRMTQAGINIIPEMDDDAHSAFAHSVQDALDWIAKFPLYEDAEIDRYSDGRVIVESKWMPYENVFEALLRPENNPHLKAEYTRHEIVIWPRNTIYEAVGFTAPDCN
jgi:hypothetical protein